jgi:hypothetical protein
MAALKEKAMTLLGSATVSMQTGAGAQTIFTVPPNKIARISHVVVRDPTASLSGATVINFTNWRQGASLTTLTTIGTDYMYVDGSATKYTEIAAGTTFQITPSTGTAGAASATVDVFGYLT